MSSFEDRKKSFEKKFAHDEELQFKINAKKNKYIAEWVSTILEFKEEQKKAERWDQIIQPLHTNIFIESNPSPVKYVAKLMGLCDDAVRLPLVTCTDKTKKILEEISKKAQII